MFTGDPAGQLPTLRCSDACVPGAHPREGAVLIPSDEEGHVEEGHVEEDLDAMAWLRV